jgi:hypothetical protein
MTQVIDMSKRGIVDGIYGSFSTRQRGRTQYCFLIQPWVRHEVDEPSNDEIGNDEFQLVYKGGQAQRS